MVQGLQRAKALSIPTTSTSFVQKFPPEVWKTFTKEVSCTLSTSTLSKLWEDTLIEVTKDYDGQGRTMEKHLSKPFQNLLEKINEALGLGFKVWVDPKNHADSVVLIPDMVVYKGTETWTTTNTTDQGRMIVDCELKRRLNPDNILATNNTTFHGNGLTAFKQIVSRACACFELSHKQVYYGLVSDFEFITLWKCTFVAVKDGFKVTPYYHGPVSLMGKWKSMEIT